MKDFEKTLNNITTKESLFQKNFIFNKSLPKYKEIDEIIIIDGKIYVYIIDNKIKVYDCISFKEISTLELPFKPSVMEIIENDSLLIYINRQVYFYKFNLKENKLKFKFYFPDIYFFTYLYKKKQIILLMDGSPLDNSTGMAKVDLSGNILLYKSKKPKIIKKFKSPKVIERDLFMEMISYKFPTQYSYFNGFNQDKYIINVSGYSDNYYCRFGSPPMEEYTVQILNSENLDEIFREEYKRSMKYKKIGDNLFKVLNQDQNLEENENELFFYDEKENKIKIFKNKIEGQYFYINDEIFAIFKYPHTIYIVDLSNNDIIKKFTLKEENSRINLKNICYYNLDKKEYVYLIMDCYNEELNGESKIIIGNIV